MFRRFKYCSGKGFSLVRKVLGQVVSGCSRDHVLFWVFRSSRCVGPSRVFKGCFEYLSVFSGVWGRGRGCLRCMHVCDDCKCAAVYVSYGNFALQVDAPQWENSESRCATEEDYPLAGTQSKCNGGTRESRILRHTKCFAAGRHRSVTASVGCLFGFCPGTQGKAPHRFLVRIAPTAIPGLGSHCPGPTVSLVRWPPWPNLPRPRLHGLSTH